VWSERKRVEDFFLLEGENRFVVPMSDKFDQECPSFPKGNDPYLTHEQGFSTFTDQAM
jgi:hypothetical protein